MPTKKKIKSRAGVGGRPTKKTPEVVKKLEEIMKIDGTIEEACAYAGISHVTYHDWVNKDQTFSNKMEDAKTYMYTLARHTLAKGIKGGDVKAAIEFLRRRDNRYKDKQENEHSGSLSITTIKYGATDSNTP